MGLAIHDLPLVRRFTPDFAAVEVLHAEIVRPFGYVISLRAGNMAIELRAAMNGTWEPSWVFEAIGDEAALKIDFTPSYVHAGSATARIRRAGTRYRPGSLRPQRLRGRVAQTRGTGQRDRPAAVGGNLIP